MEELVGWILVIVVVAVVVGAILFYTTWIVLALLARVFSVILVFWGVTFLGALLAGVIAGVVLPIRVLTGKGKAQLWQISPADIVAGTLIKRKPRSPNAEYGWDSAWPNYMPYQGSQDSRGVRLEAIRHVGIFWTWFKAKMPRGNGNKEETGSLASSRGLAGASRRCSGRP